MEILVSLLVIALLFNLIQNFFSQLFSPQNFAFWIIVGIVVILILS